MISTPLITASDIDTLGAFRLIYVPNAGERPEDLLCVPIEGWVDRAKQSQSGFDDLAFWQHELETLGAGPDAVSVILDDGRMTEAARVWFILQYFGLPAVVLNGGIDALQGPFLTQHPFDGPLRLTPGAGNVGVIERTRLKATLPQVKVFDTRTADEHSGQDPKRNARSGHLPGAALLAHSDLLDGSYLKPAPEISRLMAKAGIDEGQPIVTHCNGGGRAALAALAAVVAGRQDVAVYYLSFADWAADESCPIHRPE